MLPGALFVLRFSLICCCNASCVCFYDVPVHGLGKCIHSLTWGGKADADTTHDQRQKKPMIGSTQNSPDHVKTDRRRVTPVMDVSIIAIGVPPLSEEVSNASRRDPLGLICCKVDVQCTTQPW